MKLILSEGRTGVSQVRAEKVVGETPLKTIALDSQKQTCRLLQDCARKWSELCS